MMMMMMTKAVGAVLFIPKMRTLQERFLTKLSPVRFV